MIRLLIVDDHPIFRAGAAASLNAEGDFDIVGEASSASKALKLVREQQPDVVLTDIRLKGEVNGIELARRVRTEYPHVRLVVLTNYSNDPYIKAMMEVGVEGYILKDTSPREVAESIHLVMDGRTVFSAPVTQTIVRGYISTSANSKNMHSDKITEREAEIMQHLVNGASNAEIAEQLHVSVGTVQFHLTNIYGKLRVRSRSEAIIKAARQGLVVIDE